jgi:hypothetical protein
MGSIFDYGVTQNGSLSAIDVNPLFVRSLKTYVPRLRLLGRLNVQLPLVSGTPGDCEQLTYTHAKYDALGAPGL